jgi:uroporphyrinogen decarboxylase
MSFLRGFNSSCSTWLNTPEFVEDSGRHGLWFEEQIIEQLPAYHFDAVAFFDDWGTQNGMIISPAAWRRFFKPRYTSSLTWRTA